MRTSAVAFPKRKPKREHGGFKAPVCRIVGGV
jgi:hypothetical protein